MDKQPLRNRNYYKMHSYFVLCQARSLVFVYLDVEGLDGVSTITNQGMPLQADVLDNLMRNYFGLEIHCINTRIWNM